jgi:hypothetical protein
MAHWYRDWLRVGQPRSRSSSPIRIKNFHISISSRTNLRSTQLPIQWASEVPAPGRKQSEPEADYSPLTNSEDKKTSILS